MRPTNSFSEDRRNINYLYQNNVFLLHKSNEEFHTYKVCQLRYARYKENSANAVNSVIFLKTKGRLKAKVRHFSSFMSTV